MSDAMKAALLAGAKASLHHVHLELDDPTDAAEVEEAWQWIGGARNDLLRGANACLHAALATLPEEMTVGEVLAALIVELADGAEE